MAVLAELDIKDIFFFRGPVVFVVLVVVSGGGFDFVSVAIPIGLTLYYGFRSTQTHSNRFANPFEFDHSF